MTQYFVHKMSRYVVHKTIDENTIWVMDYLCQQASVPRKWTSQKILTSAHTWLFHLHVNWYFGTPPQC